MAWVNSLLPNLLARLPNWIVNIAALVLLALFSILALSPKMISGTIDCKTVEKERCQRMKVNANFEGRDISTLVVDGTGTFYLPIFSVFSPQSASIYLTKNNVELQVDHMVRFDPFPMWAGRQFLISVKEIRPGSFDELVIVEDGGNWLHFVTSAFASVVDSIAPTAKAQELMSYDQLLAIQDKTQPTPPLPGAVLTSEQKEEIDTAVSDALQSTVSGSKTLTSAPSSLKQLSTDDISNFNASVQEATGVSILPEHWEYITTERDAADYLKSLKGLKKEYPSVFADKTENWSAIQRGFQSQTGQSLVVGPSNF
ncbi:MAG: hypothetical protein NTV73_00065 [Hyphomicrobiales bacterium]|nr:hypothetical protein [Hyphomicrobiales bacterium]